MKWKIFLLIAVISTAVYANSFQNSFHFDDQHFIVENPFIRDIKNIPFFFLSPSYSSFEQVFTSHYRPLLVTSYAINYAIGGLRPEGYHVVNLLFHIGSAFLVYLILQAMLSGVGGATPALNAPDRGCYRSDGAFIIAVSAALIFAVHPFNSEVVNYITARSSVMCSFFYLLSFYCWVRFRQGEGENPLTSKFYHGSLLAFLLAMLTKEVAVTLPVILFLYDVYFPKPQTGGVKPAPRYFHYLPYIFLVIVPYLLYRIAVFGSITGGGTRNYLTNILTQPVVLIKYIRLMSAPVSLTIEHDIMLSHTLLSSTVIWSLASLLIILCMAYLLFRSGKERRVLSFFILWFFITLIPTTIIPLNALLQENRGYLAGVAVPLIAGILIGKLRRRLAFPAITLIVITCFILTVQRNVVWRNDLSLWGDAVAKSPASARAHDNLGLAWMGVKKYDLAIEEFNETLSLNPGYYLAYYNAGVAYQLLGDLEKARFAYEKSLEINPSYFRSYYNVGIVYKRLGKPDMAIASYDRAIALDPRHPFVYNNLGVVLTEKGDYKRAEDVFKRAIVMNPGYEKAYYNLGNVYFRNKEYVKATEAYRAAVRLRPDYKEANEMLKEALSKL